MLNCSRRHGILMRSLECLNREHRWTLTEARVVIGSFRLPYNQQRPHSKLVYRSPANDAATLPPSLAPVISIPTPLHAGGNGRNRHCLHCARQETLTSTCCGLAFSSLTKCTVSMPSLNSALTFLGLASAGSEKLRTKLP
jgi:hypothetical protein